MRPSVFTLSNINISETSEPIAIKFYLKHHLGGEKAALGRTLVFMATYSSNRVTEYILSLRSTNKVVLAVELSIYTEFHCQRNFIFGSHLLNM